MAVDLDDIFPGVSVRCAHDGEHNFVNEIAVVTDCAEMDGVRGKLRWFTSMGDEDPVGNYEGTGT